MYQTFKVSSWLYLLEVAVQISDIFLHWQNINFQNDKLQTINKQTDSVSAVAKYRFSKEINCS